MGPLAGAAETFKEYTVVRLAIALGLVTAAVAWLITWPVLAAIVTIGCVLAAVGLLAAYQGSTKAWRLSQETVEGMRWLRLVRNVSVFSMLACIASTIIGVIAVAEALA